MNRQHGLWNAFWKDRSGHVVIWQRPNLPLVVWFISRIFSAIFLEGNFHLLATALAYGALFTWAWLELFQGANYFRRLLGLIVLILMLVSRMLG